jgi:type I restriction enzyme, S subunit
MSNHPTTTIGELAVHVGSGVTPTGGSEVYLSEGVVFVRSQNVHFGRLVLDDVAFIDERTHRQMRRSEVYPHDVLLNITGASIGRCCPVPDGLGPANVNQHVCAIRLPKPRWEDALFLSTVLESPIGQEQIDRLNAGGNREGLNYQQVRSFVIPWPSEHQRTKVACVLEAIDAAIRETEDVVGKLRQMKAGLLHDLLTRGLDEQGRLRDPQRHPEQFKDSPLGRMPTTWQIKALQAVADLQVGYAFKSEWFHDSDGTRLLRGENVGYGTPDWSDCRFLPAQHLADFEQYLLAAGDVIIGMDRTFTQAGAKISVLSDQDCPALLVQRVGKFVPKSIRRDYLRCVIRSPLYLIALTHQEKGMDIPHLSREEILQPFIPIPCEHEQIKVAEVVLAHEARLRAEEVHHAKLKLQKRGLMHDLLTGRVRV